MKILILEDNPSFAQFLKNLLTGEGWEILMASSWSKASFLMKNNTFDTLILDIILPDKKGFDILEILSEKEINPNLKIALMSGFMDKSSAQNKIPFRLKSHCKFFKKPFENKELLNFIDQSTGRDNSQKEPLLLDFLFEPDLPSRKINSYLPLNKTFDSKELIPAVYLAHLKNFTGDFKITVSDNEQCLIRFQEGWITKATSVKNESFLGALLVEQGLSLSEDIETLLDEPKTSVKHKQIGEKLVEKELLSPYMLNFMLKEQIKIRLSEIMSCPSFHLNVVEKAPKDDSPPDIDFNEIDFLEWLADSLQTEPISDFLNRFYLEVQSSLVQKSMQINKPLIGQKRFLQSYNLFFKKLKERDSVSDITSRFNDKNQTLRFLYFGLLSKSIYLKRSKKESVDLKKINLLLDAIMDNDSEDLFSFLNLPWNASVEEVEKSYKILIQKIHPDLLPASAEELKEKSEKAFSKITKIYQVLKNEEKRKKYIKKQTEESFVAVIKQYEEGLTHIKTGNFKTAFDLFYKIAEHKQAPSNTVLYLLWARLKSDKTDLSKNRDKAIKIKKVIDACPISLRTSPLFWFVNGLFCSQVKQYEKAKKLFKQSLAVEKNFVEAKRELIHVKQMLKAVGNKNKKKVFNLFKKSS